MLTAKDLRHDPAPGIPLCEITPVSCRALALLVRNRETEILKTGFLNIFGTIDMIEGLEYHHGNLIAVVEDLSTKPLASQQCDSIKRKLRHEMIAYLNRMGQFYNFATSKFVTTRIPNLKTLIPVICRFLPFRNKHGAHRSIDHPRGEDTMALQELQAWQLSSRGPLVFWPKDKSKPQPDLLEQMLNPSGMRIENYWAVQMRIPQGDFLDFSVEAEHTKILAEAFGLLEKLITLPEKKAPVRPKSSAVRNRN